MHCILGAVCWTEECYSGADDGDDDGDDDDGDDDVDDDDGDDDGDDDDGDNDGLHCILGAVCWPVDRGVL